MTAVAETRPLPADLPERPSWATAGGEWEVRATVEWVAEFRGVHGGAHVTQLVRWLWIPAIGRANIYHSRLFVDQRGPGCPSWCTSHLDSDEVVHEHVIAVNGGRDVTVTMPDGGPAAILPADLVDVVDAATARSYASALLEAADLLEGGQR